MEEPFDAIEYIRGLVATNKLAKTNDFMFSTASSMNDMADMVYESRDVANHCVLVDTSSANVSIGQSGGYFETKQYTCVLLMRYYPGDEEARVTKRDICRNIKEQFHAKMVRDAELYDERDLQFFDVSNVMSQEMSDFLLNGLTGIWFIFPVVRPVDLTYKDSAWESE